MGVNPRRRFKDEEIQKNTGNHASAGNGIFHGGMQR